MLHEQFDLLVETLDVKGSTIAQYADISAARVSRLRSGAEVPQKDNATMTQLVRGILRLAEDCGKTQKLYNVMGLQASDSEQENIAHVLNWLYAATSGDRSRADRIAHFRKCFDSLLDLSGMTLKTLSEASGTDYSYIYRVHKGERFPRPGSRAIGLLCSALLAGIRDTGNLHRLTQITSIPPELCSAETLRDWMFGTMDYTATAAARDLINAIGEFDPSKLPKLPQPEIRVNMLPAYIGDTGLQAAVTRFLSSAGPGETLLLYSDHPMDWMTGSFQMHWAALMAQALRRGVYIRIIHNVERNSMEMMAALRSWIPLYLTGLITPFYSKRPRGARFRHTLFLRPGKAAVVGVSPEGAECEFHYVTDAEKLPMLEKNFEDMLADCEPLLTVSDTLKKPKGAELYRKFGETEVFADKNSAVVNKHSVPQMSFTLLHPDVVAAIRLLIGK